MKGRRGMYVGVGVDPVGTPLTGRVDGYFVREGLTGWDTAKKSRSQ